jgi:rsbT co-antagonist protein RsbR
MTSDQATYKELEAELERLRQQNADLSEQLAQRRRAEQACQENAKGLRALVETTSDWVWTVDTNAAYTFVGPTIRDFLGYEPEEILGKTPFDLMPPDEAQRVAAAFGPIVAAQQAFQKLENTNIHKDGSHVLLETSGVPFFNEQGEFQGYIGIDRDITSRREDEALLQSQEHLIRELSTPLIPIADNVVIMPLIGTIDSARAQTVMETLLEGIAAQQAELAILDITGVQIVDTQVANALIRAAQAVRLLGARVMLTGIQPQIAQTLVQLGADMGDIMTRSTLQAGVASALNGRATGAL